ncbi:MAG: chromate transporter [Candidatus Hydromicrobium sp.]|nr:chromate transporter [Candidatus Hydromicrobium sp.]
MKKIWTLFWTFFKIGSFTFGGGFAMIPLIEREIVDKKKWISQNEMIDILTISQSFPGAVAVNSAIFIGQRIGGYIGALSALLGVILPSFLTIIVVARIFTYVSNIGVVKAAFKGISSAVVALLIVAALRVGKASIKDKISPLITIIALLLLLGTGIHPIYVIILGIALGLIIYLFKIIRKKKK